MSKEKAVPVTGLIVATAALLGLLALSVHRVGWIAPFSRRRPSRVRRAGQA